MFSGANAVTNNGTMRFNMPGGSSTLTLSVGPTRDGTFLNNGTYEAQMIGATSARTHTFSNLLVNAGTMILTNESTAATGQITINITASGGMTNLAGAKLLMYNNNSNSGIGNTISLAAGNFVNAGLVDMAAGDFNANEINVTAASGIFSNASTGTIQARVLTGVVGTNFIRAATVVNLGTINVSSGTGTLFIQTSGGAAQFFNNSGTLDLSSAGIFVAASGTTNSGTLRVTTGTGTLNSSLVNLAGGIVSNIGGTLVLSNVKSNAGLITVGAGGVVQIGATGAGALSNYGTDRKSVV